MMDSTPSIQPAEPPTGPKIMVVEDNDSTREVVALLLQRAGYRVVQAPDGAAALCLVEHEKPALLIVDIDMPVIGGFGLVEEMRQCGFNQPVLMLSGHGQMDHRVKGLGLGADDFMTKPFDARELTARVAALLRRVNRHAGHLQRLEFGAVVVDLEQKTASRGGLPITLSPTEYAVLELLAREKGQPVTRERLLDVVWGYDHSPNTRTVETTIWRLRKKLGDPGEASGWIQSQPGLGYRLVLPVGKSPAADGVAPAAGAN